MRIGKNELATVLGLLLCAACAPKERNFDEEPDSGVTSDDDSDDDEATSDGNDDADETSEDESDEADDELGNDDDTDEPATDDEQPMDDEPATDDPADDSAATDDSPPDDEPPIDDEPPTDDEPPVDDEPPADDMGDGGMPSVDDVADDMTDEPVTDEPSPEGGMPPAAPVTGRVMDFYGHFLENAQVIIGDTRTLTNDQGEFTIEGVPDTYDVQVMTNWDGFDAASRGWRYEGLTRRDPLLQVFRGLEAQTGSVQLTTNDLTNGVTAMWAWASPDGAGYRSFSGSTQTSIEWRSNVGQTEAIFHVLAWMEQDDVPLSYVGHGSDSGTVGNGTAEFFFSLGASELAAGAIRGAVAETNADSRRNLMFVDFPNGVSVPVVSEYQAPDDFNYLAPQMSNATITMAAAASSGTVGSGWAMAYERGLVPGADPVRLEIPTPPQLISPPDGSNSVNADTEFVWSGDGPHIFCAYEYYRTHSLCVVTDAGTAKLPDFSGQGLTPSDQGYYTWTVQRHGFASSVDELTGSRSGYLDPFSGGDSAHPAGIFPGEGSIAESDTRGFAYVAE